MQAARVILATGIVDRMPAIVNLRTAIETGTIRLCPVCDAYEATGQRLGIIGPEKLALREALFLKGYSTRIILLANYPGDVSDVTRTSASAGGIDIWDTVRDVSSRLGCLDAVIADGSARELDVVYPAMGCDVRSDLGAALGADCDVEGYVLVNEHLETSTSGLYAIGDVARALNQIAVGFGHAAVAAAHIHNVLRDCSSKTTKVHNLGSVCQ